MKNNEESSTDSSSSDEPVISHRPQSRAPSKKIMRPPVQRQATNSSSSESDSDSDSEAEVKNEDEAVEKQKTESKQQAEVSNDSSSSDDSVTTNNTVTTQNTLAAQTAVENMQINNQEIEQSEVAETDVAASEISQSEVATTINDNATEVSRSEINKSSNESSNLSSDESVKSEADNRKGKKKVEKVKKKQISSDSDSESDTNAAFPNTAEEKKPGNRNDLFGDDTTSDSSSDATTKNVENIEKQGTTEADLFGEALSSEDETIANEASLLKEDMNVENIPKKSGQISSSSSSSDDEDISRIEVSIPKISTNLGDEIHFVRLPNFLSVQSRPFDKNYYEDEDDDEENVMDEEGKARLRLKMENTIRWRMITDHETGEEIKESNSRMIKYSDGSIVMQVGSELFDVTSMPLTDHNHLFIRQGTGLQGQAVFTQKLSFKPTSTDSLTHRKVMSRLQQRAQQNVSKVKLMPLVGGEDPFKQRYTAWKKQEDKFKLYLKKQDLERRQNVKKLTQNNAKKSMTKLTSRYLDANTGSYSDSADSTSSSGLSYENDKNKSRTKSGSKSKKKSSDSGSEEEDEEDETLESEEDNESKLAKNKNALDSDESDSNRNTSKSKAPDKSEKTNKTAVFSSDESD